MSPMATEPTKDPAAGPSSASNPKPIPNPNLTLVWPSVFEGVTIPVGTLSEHRSHGLHLPLASHDVKITFKNGTHTYASPELELGTVYAAGGRTLIGRLTFRYSYDVDDKTLTLCSTDYPSADGMTLLTVAKDTDQVCIIRASSAGFAADEGYLNESWNHHSQLMPGATQALKGIVRNANEALISALTRIPDISLNVREMLPELPADDYLGLCAVFRGGEYIDMLDAFDHTRDHDQNHDQERGQDQDEVHILQPLDELKVPESTFGGVRSWAWGADFANVIGSTCDKKVKSKSWIKLWEESVKRKAGSCTSLNWPFACDGRLYGGHVVKGQIATQLQSGSNAAYILPICHLHNSRDATYMACIQYNQAVWLNNYVYIKKCRHLAEGGTCPRVDDTEE